MKDQQSDTIARTAHYARTREIEEIFNVNFMFAHKFEFYNLTAEKGDRFMHTSSDHFNQLHIYSFSTAFRVHLCLFSILCENGNV